MRREHKHLDSQHPFPLSWTPFFFFNHLKPNNQICKSEQSPDFWLTPYRQTQLSPEKSASISALTCAPEISLTTTFFDSLLLFGNVFYTIKGLSYRSADKFEIVVPFFGLIWYTNKGRYKFLTTHSKCTNIPSCWKRQPTDISLP
jgi:hypothetical protein